MFIYRYTALSVVLHNHEDDKHEQTSFVILMNKIKISAYYFRRIQIFTFCFVYDNGNVLRCKKHSNLMGNGGMLE